MMTENFYTGLYVGVIFDDITDTDWTEVAFQVFRKCIFLEYFPTNLQIF